MKYITLLTLIAPSLVFSVSAFSGPFDNLKDKAKEVATDGQKRENAKVELQKAKEAAGGAMDTLNKKEPPAPSVTNPPVADAGQKADAGKKPLPKKPVKKPAKKPAKKV